MEYGVKENSNHPIELVSMSKFDRGLKAGQVVHLGLVALTVGEGLVAPTRGELHFTHGRHMAGTSRL